MPITALDILPARAEPVSLSGLETGFKTHGTSTGKNDGPSFREMLEKAEQKDTTDGKIKESDSASQKKTPIHRKKLHLLPRNLLQQRKKLLNRAKKR